MMYISKINEFIHIKNYEELINRHKKHIVILLNGIEENHNIIVQFNVNNLVKLTSFLKKVGQRFEISAELSEILINNEQKDNQFEEFKNNALEIKNANKITNKGYIKFIQVIKDKMVRQLYEHQLKSAYHMAFALNSCNFSVPGAGKTTIVYAAYAYLKEMHRVDKIMIIGPLSSSLAWKNEFKDCFGYEADFINLNLLNTFERKEYFKSYTGIQNEISFINYESLSNVKKDIKSFFEKNKVMVVLDEAHKIKNPSAKRTINIMNFAELASSRIILTGTPIPNGYVDLYNLFEFIWPKKNIIGFNVNQLRTIHENNNRTLIKQLMDNIDPFYIRISKQMLNLPKPVFNKPIMVEMGIIQQRIYNFIADDFLKSDFHGIDDELRFELKKAKLVRLMQSVTNPSAIIKSLSPNDYENSSIYKLIKDYEKLELPPKYTEVLRLTEELINNNQKVIIWTQYVHNIKKLGIYLTKYKVSVKYLYGQIDSHEREEIIKEFHENEDLKVLIANPSAVAESISLHKVCHNAIYLDMSFNASHYMQSKDRIHRVGLEKNAKVNYYFIHSKGSIDEVIYQRVLEKETNMHNVIEGKEVPLFSSEFGSDLSNEDLQKVVEYLKKRR